MAAATKTRKSKGGKSTKAPKNAKHNYTVVDRETGETVFQSSDLNEIKDCAGFMIPMLGESVTVTDEATGKSVNVDPDTLDNLDKLSEGGKAAVKAHRAGKSLAHTYTLTDADTGEMLQSGETIEDINEMLDRLDDDSEGEGANVRVEVTDEVTGDSTTNCLGESPEQIKAEISDLVDRNS